LKPEVTHQTRALWDEEEKKAWSRDRQQIGEKDGVTTFRKKAADRKQCGQKKGGGSSRKEKMQVV